MESVLFTPLTHVPGCSKYGRLCKGHPFPNGTNCALALAKEHADKSRETLACGVEGPVVLLLPGPSAVGQPAMVDNAAQVPREQHPKPPDRTTQEKTASLITTMTTITTGGSTECSLAVLSTRLGQQDEQLARDRCPFDELSQQLCDTTTQFTHISKFLDQILVGCTHTATLAEVPAVPGTSLVSGAAPPGQASSLPQQSTASSEVNPSASTFHINRQAAPCSHTGFPQSRKAL